MNAYVTSAAERRRHPRTVLRMSLRCLRLDPDGGDVNDTLHMTDISRSGMGAVCDRAFYRGQRVLLCLPASGTKTRRNVYASVIRSAPTTDGYQVGLEFDRSSAASWLSAPAAAMAA